MKYKAGDVLQVKSLEWFEENKEYDDLFQGDSVRCGCTNFIEEMIPFLGKTITVISLESSTYNCEEDGDRFSWTDEMFEGLANPTKKEKLIELIQDNFYLPQEEFNILIESYLDSLIPYNHGNFEISESCNIDAISVTNRIKELRDEYKGSDFSIIVENIIKRLSKRELAFLMLANYITAK